NGSFKTKELSCGSISLSFIVVLAFLREVVDGSIGMEWGTTLTPALLMMGFDPLQVGLAVLISQLAGNPSVTTN
ncbi:hypothetical protein KAU55_05650, partial [Candidatus Bathyarchaeota archaeon]|nr:hypothetical protein [Candidatus Bathyarchaeota archaeon]